MVRDALAEITDLTGERGLCKVAVAINKIDEGLREGLLKALERDSGLPSIAIGKWLSREGLPVSERSIQRHRGEQCVCIR